MGKKPWVQERLFRACMELPSEWIHLNACDSGLASLLRERLKRPSLPHDAADMSPLTPYSSRASIC